MKLRPFIIAIIILLIGFALTIIGALMKIMHWPYGGETLIVGSVFKVLAIVIAISKLIAMYRSQD